MINVIIIIIAIYIFAIEKEKNIADKIELLRDHHMACYLHAVIISDN